MPTKIYYKEKPSESDPTVMDPVLIDTLFRPRAVAEDKEPANKETGIREISIDLSNLFQLADTDARPSVLASAGEKTNIYASREDKEFSVLPIVKSVSRRILHAIPNQSTGIIQPDLTITIPSQYRDRWLFYKTEAKYGANNCYPTGGFIPPKNTTFKIKSPSVGLVGALTEINVYLHEVTLEESTSPAGYADLSEIFADKGEVFADWWQPLLHLTSKHYALNYYDDDGGGTVTAKVEGLPKGEFTYRVVGGQWYHSGLYYADWVPSAVKKEGATGVSFSFYSTGYGWVFGIHPSELE